MPEKSSTISVRISDEDAEFLARLKLSDARTASEKMRHIISQARKRQAGFHDYPAALETMRELFDAVQQRLRDQERQQNIHSELLTQSFEWLTDLAAYLLSGTDQEVDRRQQISLETLEAGVAERLFRIMDALLRLGVTPESPCYDPSVVRRNLPRILSLARIIEAAQVAETD